MSTSEPASAGTQNPSEDRQKWVMARDRLAEALKLLDESNAPAEVGAQLDLAIHRLNAAIDA